MPLDVEENEAEDDVLVLGRVHVAAQLIVSEPELRFKANVGGGIDIALTNPRHSSQLFIR